MTCLEKTLTETTRLDTLRSLNILDTPEEERFDRLTRLAIHLFDVPFSFVSLLDDSRQWFKSVIGLGMTEVSRTLSLCRPSLATNKPLIVNDALFDSRFCSNPLVRQDPGFRFYASYPLRHSNGSLLGTFCIADSRPRELTKQALADLKVLAGMAEREVVCTLPKKLDPITGITDRSGFLVMGQKCLSTSAQKAQPASLVVLDINEFAALKARLGIQEVDKAQQAVANLLRLVLWRAALFSRVDEGRFCVLMVNMTPKQVEADIDKFHQALAIHTQDVNRGYEVACTDVILTPKDIKTQSIKTLLGNIDALMYAKKHKGQFSRFW